MADRKKKKDKDKRKDRKRDKEDKKKRRKSRHSSVDSDDSSDDDSDSSVSERHHKRDKEKKKGIKKDKDKKKSVSEKETPAATSNNPYDFSSVSVIPVIKGMNVPLPPPMPNTSSAAPVPKPKVKEPNIFKLLPKLPYGCVLFAKTIYSGEYLSEEVFDTVLHEATRSIEQTCIQEQHKKGISGITKCIAELDKVYEEERKERERLAIDPLIEPVKEKSNRYENLNRVFNEHMEKAKLMST